MSIRSLALALLLLAPAAGLARADDKPAPTKKMIDNPQYAAWSGFKVGATAKYEQDAGVPGQKTTMTWKLVELTAEKAVLEMTMTSVMGDQSFDMPAQRTEVPKQIEEVKPAETPDAPKPEMKEGTGDVTTPAGTFSCKTVETKVTMTGMSSVSKIWTSKDVPGGMVKMESDTTMAEGTHVKSTMTLVALTK